MDIPLPDSVALPPAQTQGGMPLMSALAARRSARAFSQRPLEAQLLSNLLWAAGGINRADGGGRTAPSAHNWREIEIYVAQADGLSSYHPLTHSLRHESRRDLRAESGVQDFVATAPLNLIYVADLARVDAIDPVERRFYCAADAAFCAQNVYLFCASAGLACVVRGVVNRRALAQSMELGLRQRVILAQTVGYPAV